MALREDYYTPCAGDINRRIGAIEYIQTDIRCKLDKLGVENSLSKEKTIEDINRLLILLEDVRELLISEKGKLVSSVADL